MIGANYMALRQTPPAFPPLPSRNQGHDGKDKLVAALKASFKFCEDAIAKIDDSKLGEVSTGPDGTDYSRAVFALGIASNWPYHYAHSLNVLCRLNGPDTADDA